MTKIILRIYDLFRKSPALASGLFLAVTAALVASVLTLSYKEDISDFLPLDRQNQTALSVYQDISGANKIYAIISTVDNHDVDPDSLVSGVEAFVDKVTAMDSLGYLEGITKSIDMEGLSMVVDEVYDNIPYFLTDGDYCRIDSLLAIPGYVAAQLDEDKQLLMFPTSGVVVQNISRDPLNLFTPVLGRLQQGGMPVQFEMYDGYILSPDSRRAIVILESAFGAHESENNARLVAMLNAAVAEVEADIPGLSVHITGGPVIAVSNASQIKTDSILAVCIAGILILLLLIYVFRNVWNILLIIISVGWGWIFAMGGIALYYDSVSIIVIGIASVILGIAVNYPLHLIDHLKDSLHPRAALKEIISPLIVGNITTVGAFMCLVPLNAPALHDLGLFSSLLLIGTIIFVLIFLPHIVRTKKKGAKSVNPILITKIAGVTLESNRYAVWGIILLTCFFAYFSLNTEFDSDMRNINFMTDTQKSDLEYFQSLFSTEKGTESLYIVSSGESWDEALRQNEIINPGIDSLQAGGMARRHNAVSSFLLSKAAQEKRLHRWHSFLARHAAQLSDSLTAGAAAAGFNPEAFAQFEDIVAAEYRPKEFSEFESLISTVFTGNVSRDAESGRHSVIQTVEVPAGTVEAAKAALAANREFGGLIFDVKSMNGSIADTLSGDFNYIGIACGCIVFLFLWLSFGSIELAVVSFLPMAVSWIWILGIMGLLGIKFNIVNVILATFIFGQGDDYTIFMTEGLTYEFAYRRKLLASYKNSIVVSALIMFIGIGTLIFARHPALRSLGEVTVVGMLSVVLMACLFPPLVFNWLVRKGGRVRYRPVTLKKILYTGVCAATFLTQLMSAYVIGFFLFVVTRPTPAKRLWLRRYTCSVFRFDIKRMPGIRLMFENKYDERFDRPAVIICNHQSMLDSFCLMALSPRIILLAGEHIRVNPVIRVIFRWCNFMSVQGGAASIVDDLRPLVREGYSIAVFPEGARPEAGFGEVMRFHKGPFLMAKELNLDIVPVFLYGLTEIMPKGAALSNGGTMYIGIGKRVSCQALGKMGDFTAQSRMFRSYYREHLREIHSRVMTVGEAARIVGEKYLYKGRGIEMSAAQTLKAVNKYSGRLSAVAEGSIFVNDLAGQGELAMVLALMYPRKEVYCHVADGEAALVFKGCIVNFASNIHYAETSECDEPESVALFVVCSGECPAGSVAGLIINV